MSTSASADDVDTDAPTDPAATLTISALQERTGVPAATLRSWEQRLGFPVPNRSPGGQRRYRAEDAELVRRVQSGRDAGLSLAAAVAAVRREQYVDTESLFAQVRRAHPELDVMTVGARILKALTWAMEDECLAHASRPVLLGCFQSKEMFLGAGNRWRELARGARRAVVVSDFETTDPSAVPERVGLPADSPMLNEWTLVCHDSRLSVALVAWEPPPRTASMPRRLECLLTLDPVVVSDTASRFLAIARSHGLPDTNDLVDQFAGATEDPRRSASLLRRFAVYADG